MSKNDSVITISNLGSSNSFVYILSRGKGNFCNNLEKKYPSEINCIAFACQTKREGDIN